MKTTPVSFGNVYAVSGKMKSMKNLNYSLQAKVQEGKIIKRDITDSYKNAPSDGLLAKAAQRGEGIALIVTGEDVKKVNNNEPGWTNLSDILTHMDKYYDLRKENFYRTVRDIINK